MTQSVTNTLNNIEQMLSIQETPKKVTDVVDSGMDKTTDFEKVFDSTLNKEVSTLAEVKESTAVDEVSVVLPGFKEILEKATDEANVETALDLTLAKDIEEIISQLKEAVENATEIIEESSKTEEVDVEIVEDLVQNENFVSIFEDSEPLVDDNSENLSEDESNSEQKIPFEQVLVYADKISNNIDLSNEFAEISSLKEEASSSLETDTSKFDIKSTQAEIIEFAENLVDEVVSTKTKNETSEPIVQELNIDEEIVKELKITSISAETDTTGGETLMQNQTPEEYAVKAMINNDIETFEVKIDAPQNLQLSQQVQPKTADVNPSRIIDQIAKQMEGLQNGGKVNMVLNPESLGKVNIQLLSTKEGLTAQFTVTTQEARDLLSKGLDGLKESLGAHGVAVDNVSVKVADSQKSEYGQDWTEQDGSRGGNKRQGQPNREEKEKGLFEKMMAQTQENENGNV